MFLYLCVSLLLRVFALKGFAKKWRFPVPAVAGLRALRGERLRCPPLRPLTNAR